MKRPASFRRRLVRRRQYDSVQPPPIPTEPDRFPWRPLVEPVYGPPKRAEHNVTVFRAQERTQNG